MGGTILIFLVLMASWMGRGTSLAGTKNWREAVERAAEVGDYRLARELVRKQQVVNSDKDVLGADSELDELVYPERKVQRVITSYEELNRRYPGHRDILLTLSKLYAELGNGKQAESYRGAARALDPNNPIFQP